MSESPCSSNGTVRLRARVLRVSEIGDREVRAWSALEQRASEPNAYLSPHHVVPLARLGDADEPLILFVEVLPPHDERLVGVAVLQPERANRVLPLAHLQGFRSRYTCLSGLLLDRGAPQQALAALLEGMRVHAPRSRGLVLGPVYLDGAVAQLVRAHGGHGTQALHDARTGQRAVLRRCELGEAALAAMLGKRKGGLDRRRRRLSELGTVDWRCYREGGIPEHAVEAFLRLEHAGWKGQQGSSLRSNPAHERLFRAMVAGFGAEGRVFFTELTLDGEPIASASNFISQRAAFAFKIGWHPDFAKYSPGILNEIEMIRRAPEVLPDIDEFDSGAAPDSYINELWRSRRPLAQLVVPTGVRGRVALRALGLLRSAKAGLRARVGRSEHADDARPDAPGLAPGASSR